MSRRGQQARPLDEIAAEWKTAARQHGEGTEQGDSKKTNAAYDKVARLSKQIKASGPDGERVFLEMLKNEDASVRSWAAFNLLTSQPAVAEAELERIASLPGLVAFSAEIALEEWRAGRFKPD